MEYNFREIEQKWQQEWINSGAYRVPNRSDKPKYYVLDMFPYPSGAGLHVGHPLGYIASDIFARYKRLKGFNVLHPMGYDAFGLPAEQYAIEHGVHPAVSTAKNIATFRGQLDKIGFSFDWSREVNTSNPGYYKWTQWIFLQLFKSWYNRKTNKTESIDGLVKIFEAEGNFNHPIPNSQFQIPDYPHVTFTSDAWYSFTEKQKQAILMEYRVAYCGYGEVNWCEVLGTVLANDEVVNGVSERGGYPVVKKKLRQWYLRITEYADRLLEGLQRVDFSDAMKEMQTNWIGKSSGAEIDFAIAGHDETLRVYTTRPDTIFGVDFMVVAPEHELVERITTPDHKQAVEDYIAYVKSRSERERMAEKKISGVFTGAYAVNPFDERKIPIWISEYVLAGYGTGAIMAVPSGDERDHKFANHFNLPITNILGDAYNGQEANPTKDAVLSNSGFLNGMVMRDAIDVVINKLEEMGIGKRKVNFKMRDAAFSRQRYWGEPFPIKWKNGIAYPLDESELPLELPYVESYGPGPEGEGPLANIPEWTAQDLETNTMPGYAGSSWYFLRYMDPHNDETFCDKNISSYWNQVDLYVGGTEHAVGHLLYSRMWTKCLFDLDLITFDEPYKKLLNQGMIQGSSRFVYRVRGTNQYVSAGLKEQYEVDSIHVDVNIVDGVELDTEAFKNWKPDFADAEFILEDGKYICGVETEKMSKSKVNTVNPDHIVERFGADTFRMYEMFLGPVEMSKPWDTKGIEGVHRFLKKLWRLFFDEMKGSVVTNDNATPEELKVLHRTIKKIAEDTERFSFNTCVSAFMVCVNELTDLKCHKRDVLEQLLILLTPYAPHISEELWHQLGHTTSILDASYPAFESKYLVETTKEYPVSINGKMRTTMVLDLAATQEQVQDSVLQNPVVQKWMEGKPLKKLIFVKGKMINVVI
uniref:leucine--tRNA ligase n=1 Tax=Flavisolibacter nicotianae TaxID=2364882 RepID=UPI000EAC9BDB|nr:leucine--tRNA ligase [Flavisolibacter nicotianae]